MTEHSFPPVIQSGARLLILGSMPGAASLKAREYYAFRFNAFWRIMEDLYGIRREWEYGKRLQLLREQGIALWDVLECCERKGSLDSNIRAEIPHDVPGLLKEHPEIRRILCNGTGAFTFLRKHFPFLWEDADREILKLPSTSPAAAMYSYERKRAEWARALRG